MVAAQGLRIRITGATESHYKTVHLGARMVLCTFIAANSGYCVEGSGAAGHHMPPTCTVAVGNQIPIVSTARAYVSMSMLQLCYVICDSTGQAARLSRGHCGAATYAHLCQPHKPMLVIGQFAHAFCASCMCAHKHDAGVHIAPTPSAQMYLMQSSTTLLPHHAAMMHICTCALAQHTNAARLWLHRNSCPAHDFRSQIVHTIVCPCPTY
jgi:hypothetical protein